MFKIRHNIKNHLHLTKQFNEIALEVLCKNKQENVVAEKYFNFVESRQLFNKKIDILRKKKKYFESKYKFEAAIKNILSKQLSISDAAKQYKIDEQELHEEYEKFNQLGVLYQYDKITDNGVFTFIEEYSLLQYLNFRKTTNPHNFCFCCYCALEFLLYLAYEFAYKNKKKYPFTWDIYKRADEVWLYEFEMRHSEEISMFSSICAKESLYPSQIFDIHRKFDIRQKIRHFLYLRRRYEKIIREILSKNNTLKIIIQKYGINAEEYRIIQIVINILTDKQKYFKERDNFVEAIKDIMSGETIQNAAQKFDINQQSLTQEFKKYTQLGKKYEYDRNTTPFELIHNRNFTFVEEFLILDKLRLWEKNSQSTCFCQICALECLLISDEFALTVEKEIPSWDKYGKGNENWLYEFEIRHSERISEGFAPDCKKDMISLWKSTSQIFSSLLFNNKKISIISSSHLQKDVDPLQIYNIHIMSGIRKKIKEYLKYNTQLEEAVKKVLNENKNITIDITEQYGCSSETEIVNKTIFNKTLILEKRKEYLTLKDNIDMAINDILYLHFTKKFDKTESICMISRKYNIVYETLYKEFIKFCELKITYKFDQPVLKHEVFTFIEEFSLLEKLHLWKTTTRDCTCQVCALECVFKLAYIFSNINRKNKIMNEDWILEFHMKHSTEISKFSHYSYCKMDKLLSSHPLSSFVAENIWKPNTSSTHQAAKQRGLNLPQIPNVTKMSHMKRIKKYLEVRDKLEAAALDVIIRKMDVQATVMRHGLTKKDLKRKIYVTEKMSTYHTHACKINLAMNEYFTKASTIKAAANYHGISRKTLKNEIDKHIYWISLGTVRMKNHIACDRLMQRAELFTLHQESLLIKDLLMWKEIFQPYCFCQACAMKQLLNLASQQAQYEKSLHPKEQRSKIKQSVINWLIDFEMKYTFLKRFLPDCLKIPSETQKLATKKSKFSLVSKSHSSRSGLRRRNVTRSRISNIKDVSVQE